MNAVATILDMAKNKSQSGKPKAKPKPVQEPQDDGSQLIKTVYIEVPIGLWKVFDAVRARNHRKITAEIQVAMEEHIRKHGGVWPPVE